MYELPSGAGSPGCAVRTTEEKGQVLLIQIAAVCYSCFLLLFAWCPENLTQRQPVAPMYTPPHTPV